MSEVALMTMENSYPRSLRTLVARLVGFTCNTFTVMPQGANRGAQQGSKISFALPSNALLNLRSITLCMPYVRTTCVTNGAAPPTAGVAGVLGRASDLFEQVNIYINGVAITNSVQQFNTLTRMLDLQHDNVDRQVSSGCLEGHDLQAEVITALPLTPAPVGLSRALCFNNIFGLLSNSSCRYLDCSLFGDCRIEFVCATNNVLSSVTHAAGSNVITQNPTDIIGQPSYVIERFHLECEAVQIANGMYSELQRAKIAQQDFIQINYKDAYTLEADGGTGTANTVRFSASSQSVDCLLATFRQANYTAGMQSGAAAADCGYGAFVLPQAPMNCAGVVPTGQAKESTVPHYFAFRSFFDEGAAARGAGGIGNINTGGGAVGPWPSAGPGTPLFQPSAPFSTVDPVGTWSQQMRVNGIAHPQQPADELSAYKNTNLYGNSQKWNTSGNSITGQWNYRYGQYLSTTRLNMEPDTHSEMECARISGFDSRSINSDFTVVHNNLLPDQAAVVGPPALASTYGAKSTFVAVITTASLRAGAGKSVARIP